MDVLSSARALQEGNSERHAYMKSGVAQRILQTQNILQAVEFGLRSHWAARRAPWTKVSRPGIRRARRYRRDPRVRADDAFASVVICVALLFVIRSGSFPYANDQRLIANRKEQSAAAAV
jgi:hypothetical protein